MMRARLLVLAGLCAAALSGCGGSSGPAGSPPPASAQMAQVVFMKGVNGAVVPGPGAIFEIAVMNLDGSGLRQLTNDGKFKFLPHFSPDGKKIAYTKYAVGQYGTPDAVTDIAVLDLASGTENVITRDGHAISATWAPDGSRLAYINTLEASIWTIGADGSGATRVARSRGTEDDQVWGDTAWSRDNWLLFTVIQDVGHCAKARLDKMRPDGSQRTPVTDGGPNCTPNGLEQSGDADPGWSADGTTIYSSRGFPRPPAGLPAGAVERRIYAVSSQAWYPGKPEVDISLAGQPNCVEGVPKGSPDGKRLLLFRACFDTGQTVAGIYVTDTAGSYRTRITEGFGPDWNPTMP